MDLNREFAGWYKRQRKRLVLLGYAKLVQNRKAKRQGLTRTSLCLAANISAGDGVGNRQLLNRKRFDDALISERFDDWFSKSKVSKSYSQYERCYSARASVSA